MDRRTLTYKTHGYAPGYRDLTLVLADSKGQEYELRLTPEKVQSVIYACADVAKQIGAEGPIDWDAWPATIHWPTVTVWKPVIKTA